MAVCVIGEREKQQIDAAVGKARKRPIPLDVMARVAKPWQSDLPLSERPDMSFRDKYPAVEVLIPVGYRACVSFEEQPDGLALHLSISAERKDPKWMPSEQAIQFIATAFGIDMASADAIWTEEYEPGRRAINMIKIVEERPVAGHA